MTLRALEIFITVCETGSMSAAARKLYMTQPAISQTILGLEDKLNVRLFDRIKKRLILTHAGEIFLRYSKRIVNLINEAENAMTDIANLKLGQLRIGASMTIGTYLLPDIISAFNKKHQDVELPFIIDNTKIIRKMILNNEIDIAFIEGPINSNDIIIEPFFDDELYLVCSIRHEWANKDSISSEKIRNESFIMREKGSGTREVIENTLKQFNLSYEIKHVLNNIDAIKKAIEANMGISILPKIAIKKEIVEGKLAKIKLDNIKFKRKFKIIYHKDKYHSPLFNKFIDYIKSSTQNFK
ncbi:selenium metabolism-associated LysR family transcriptional regulator [Selenihalanaerobacter shriftii]|uniref:Transcriptional regulator n=1 Tax=Selenihalanaerobacter shriftii TaxID=142842 RepID=A0A1T4JU76_9FIRM|nr:selenium metabolism-associated LysR family transcriptional regulator [Selenihalanaerobacter shriftii]SJZ33665.1 transcriptional regulator [Selenihalanaerobacter shriftii]